VKSQDTTMEAVLPMFNQTRAHTARVHTPQRAAGSRIVLGYSSGVIHVLFVFARRTTAIET
jgi:hypothetical protein